MLVDGAETLSSWDGNVLLREMQIQDTAVMIARCAAQDDRHHRRRHDVYG
jgi:hypothetical protein